MGVQKKQPDEIIEPVEEKVPVEAPEPLLPEPSTSRSTLLGTWSSSHNRNDRLDFFWSGDLAIWR